MRLKIMEWNIHGAAALPWNKEYEIKRETVDRVMGQEPKADIIVLTEFCVAKGWDHLQEQLQENGYIWFMNYTSGKNGTLICIKSDRIDESDKLIGAVYNQNIISCGTNDCNYLQVSFQSEKKRVTVLGCRMETGEKVVFPDKRMSEFPPKMKEEVKTLLLKEQYDSQRKAFDEVLMPALNWHGNLGISDIYIVCGDFNNAACHGSLNQRYDPNDYRGLAQINYNLNLIKDAFDQLGFTWMDNDGGKPIMTYSSKGPRFPLDHIFVRGANKLGCKAVPGNGLSDHDILLAEVEVKP